MQFEVLFHLDECHTPREMHQNFLPVIPLQTKLQILFLNTVLIEVKIMPSEEPSLAVRNEYGHARQPDTLAAVLQTL